MADSGSQSKPDPERTFAAIEAVFEQVRGTIPRHVLRRPLIPDLTAPDLRTKAGVLRDGALHALYGDAGRLVFEPRGRASLVRFAKCSDADLERVADATPSSAAFATLLNLLGNLAQVTPKRKGQPATATARQIAETRRRSARAIDALGALTGQRAIAARTRRQSAQLRHALRGSSIALDAAAVAVRAWRKARGPGRPRAYEETMAMALVVEAFRQRFGAPCWRDAMALVHDVRPDLARSSDDNDALHLFKVRVASVDRDVKAKYREVFGSERR